MGYLALSKDSLTRLSHHWLWGLRVDNTSGENFYCAAEYLQKTPSVREKIQEQLALVSQYTFFFQILYWLFNFNDYRLHYYQLQAYLSWELYKEGEKMFTNVSSWGVTLPEGFILGTATIASFALFTRQPLQPHIKRGMEWFSHNVRGLFPKVIERADVSERETVAELNPSQPPLTTALVVTSNPALAEQGVAISSGLDDEANPILIDEEMLAPLAILGISKPIGYALTFKELKYAYHQSCLKTHPDITRTASNNEFRATKEAYERLLSIIRQKLSTDSSLSDDDASLLAKMVALDKEILAELKVWREMNAQARQLTDRLEQMGERLDGNAVRLEQMGERLDGSAVRLEQMGEQLHKQDSQLNALVEWVSVARAARGLQSFTSLTQEEIDGPHRDPDYFVKQAQVIASKESDIARQQVMIAKLMAMMKELQDRPTQPSEAHSSVQHHHAFFSSSVLPECLTKASNIPSQKPQ